MEPNQPIDECHNAKHWCIMEEFQIFNLIRKRVDMAQTLQGLSYEVRSTIYCHNFFSLDLFILVLGICAIIHQHIVAMLRGFVRFVYKR